MKKSFTSFCRRNLAFFRLAILTNLEYRFNFITDAFLQPIMMVIIELTLWVSLFNLSSAETLGGFGRESYFSYVLWSSFITRITTNWMYEYRMIEEIHTGSINSLIVRPFSFFEYYLSQFMGYKFIVLALSIFIPIFASFAFNLPFELNRLPLVLFIIFYYLILVHLLSYFVSTLAFFLNRIHSVTMAKNLALWFFSGELFPLDLLPENIKDIVLILPFSNAVYIPVAYLTGRIQENLVYQGLLSISVSIIGITIIAGTMWKMGLRKYVGTGA